MYKMVPFALLLVLSTLAAQARAQLTAQQSIDEATAQIISLLNSGGNDTTELVDIVDVDSMVGDVNTYFGHLQDPHGTLKGAFVFTAEVPEAGGYEGEVGVFKNGQILWTSGLIIPESNGRIFATMDLAKSGSVDIVTTWLAGLTGQREHMWIFSWDGKTGIPINPFHREGSRIVGNRGSFEIEDLNGDGKYEITCQLDTDDVEYVWDGNTFQTIVNPPVLSNNTFSPADNFTITLSAETVSTHAGYKYIYTVSNALSSAQSINNVMIAACLDSIGEYAPEGWTCLSVKAESLARFVVEIGISNTIVPGMSIKGFEIISKYPPAISAYYAQAPHNVPSYEPDQLSTHLSEFTNDFLNNSVRGYTIAPHKLPDTFVPRDFLDTLISYKHRSFALGWLGNDKRRERECERTVRTRGWYKQHEVGKMRRWEADDSWDFDKDWNNGIIGILDKKLEKAKQALIKGDSVKARRELQIFVMEVELVYGLGEKQEARNKQSEVRNQTPVMTSEAYALLKYNAEYLIDRLPVEHRRGRK